MIFVTFPTPAIKYRIIRFLMELVNAWQFWDEKPLKYEQVRSYFEDNGNVKKHFLNKKLPLSQMVVVTENNRKDESGHHDKSASHTGLEVL